MINAGTEPVPSATRRSSWWRLTPMLVGVASLAWGAGATESSPPAAAQVNSPSKDAEADQTPRVRVIRTNHPSGVLKSSLPVVTDAALHGVARQFYESGIPREESHWVLGVRDGRLSRWSEAGTLAYQVTYKGGMKHGREAIYDQEGRLRIERHYIRDQRWGAERVYHETGSLKRLTNYRANRKHGEMREYNEQGRLVESVHYRRGRFHGTRTVYDGNGDPQVKIDYFDGVAIGRDGDGP